jgi:hypothetical protein
MYTIFHLKADELDEKFLKKLKNVFGKKNIAITVEEDIDETEYLLASPANRRMLKKINKRSQHWQADRS